MFPLLLATVLISTPLVPPIVKDAQSLYEYERANFTYQTESKDRLSWNSPAETVKNKGGNCADFALYNEAVLKQLGYETQAMAIYGKQNGEVFFHAITVVKMENGKYKYFSNQFFSYYRDFEMIEDVINFECPEWKWYSDITWPNKFINKHIQTN